MSFYDEIIEGLKASYGEGTPYKNYSTLATASGISPTQLHRYLTGKSSSSLECIGKVMDRLGAKVIFSRGGSAVQTRNVSFVAPPQIVEAGKGLPPVSTEDYLAVPLVEEGDAGPGVVPQAHFESWFLIWKLQKSVMYKKDLIAIRLSKSSTAMKPTLRPEDIVLVDRQDTDCESYKGRIMLVMDPSGTGQIRRVSVKRLQSKRDIQIIFYGDNTEENAPDVWSLSEDYGGDWTRAVAGHVVWAWSDMVGR